MTKQRDTQRSKVYRAETHLKAAPSEGLTVAECQALIDKWASSAVLRRRYPLAADRCEVRDGRGHRNAVYYRSYAVSEAGFFTGWRPVIHLPKWARSKLVLAHEYAHHLAPEGVPPHGHEWAAIYLDLVRSFIGRWAEDELKASFKAHRVKFRPPVKRTMTDAQRQAARERMAALNATRQTALAKAKPEPVRVRVEAGGKVVAEWTADEEDGKANLPEPHALEGASCPGNVGGSSFVSGIRRALHDARLVDQGIDPERPSERAMRLSA